MTDDRYTSPLAAGLAADLLARFVGYVRIDTQARRDREQSPSTPGQLELGALLVEELQAAGLKDASQDENGYVTASLAGTGPTIGLVAHLDTSPDAPGRDVRPIVHERWGGQVIELPRSGTRLDPEAIPELRGKLGHDIVTASGDTLLGADDKAGVAIIMAAVAWLVATPELPRANVKVCFTPDEEIGEGATLFDIPGFGAQCAYTIDGSELGEIQDETFSAQEAILTVDGVDVHPGQATGKLVSALRLAARIVAALPPELTPEATTGRQGFIHPYELTGTAAHAQIRAIVRDFDDDKLAGHVELLRRVAEGVVASEPKARLKIDVRTQYRNMRRYLDEVPDVTAAAVEAIRSEGIEPIRTPIRGGTDGSRLSEMGLPTPNIFTGGHEYHSVREWASVQDMAASAAVVVRLAGLWAHARPTANIAAPESL
ncbi:MAG: tripeptide aminopeptidase [Solirubrobacteraceae bacterium]|jgi:tripeptide aminopeptidase|nr:tripeptide aminopeptidase [Solirubrobacteraceae bacterium]